MSAKNIINDPKYKEEAMIAWLGVRGEEDVREWHKIYTPWWSDEHIDKLIQVYKKQMETNDEDSKLMLSEFERLYILNKNH